VSTFPAYTELPTHLPRAAWHTIRVASVTSLIVLCLVLFLRPATGLFLFWEVMVPLLPAVFFVAPGLWRNICPLAAANQAPRLFGFAQALNPPDLLRQRGYLVAIIVFFTLAAMRRASLKTSGPATAILLLACLLGAFIGGIFLKGKSGWCSSICPLLPVQRLYGQTPFVTVPNSHCTPCVGCARNCYDFNPQVAYQADLHEDAAWSSPRKLFAGAFPGFVLGFFTIPGPPVLSSGQTYLRLAVYVLVSAGSFFVLDTFLPRRTMRLTTLYAAAAINIFYWFSALTLTQSLQRVTGMPVGGLRWLLRAAVIVLSVVWIWRTTRLESQFLKEAAPGPLPVPAKVRPQTTRATHGHSQGKVRFMPEDTVVAVEPGMSLLDAAERARLPIEVGCRMGICGADPVAILDGMEALSEPDSDEQNTLRRLGLAANTRMACCARVEGSVAVSLTPERGDLSPAVPSESFDPSIGSVVVIGNGIAGVTAAEHVRRNHATCDVHIVGREAHVLYNRMSISRLIYGRSAMQGLYLLAEDWYDEHDIVAWLNTHAVAVDVHHRTVMLGTGDRLVFDRLILAMGSSSFVPPIAGFGRPGTFVLREASDAIGIRAYAQQHACRRAVVAGGGLLGLEAAYALRELGLDVAVLERSDRLLSKQVDARCSELVAAHFNKLGIEIVHTAETASVRNGNASQSQCILKDGRILECDIFLVCTGIRPNVALARAAGLEVNRGVLVNDRMETSAKGVYAAGDVAEHRNQLLGLWPTAVRQAEVAAINALGKDVSLEPEPPVTILKGVGLELTTIGQVHKDSATAIVVEDDVPTYCKLVIREGKAAGAIVLGHRPTHARWAIDAVKRQVDIPHDALDALRQGRWNVLEENERPADRCAQRTAGRPQRACKAASTVRPSTQGPVTIVSQVLTHVLNACAKDPKGRHAYTARGRHRGRHTRRMGRRSRRS
jgi:nitrite reductase (NADH) large subunit